MEEQQINIYLKKTHTLQVRKRAILEAALSIPLQLYVLTHSCPNPRLLFLPLSLSMPLFHLSPFPASAPHPISVSFLINSGQDNGAIVAPVREPEAETNAVYQSSVAPSTRSFITAKSTSD